MTDPKAAAISFEAIKVSMSQTRDGIKIVLVVHPNDDTQDLFNHPVGSRYQTVMVQMDDEGQPVVPKSRSEGERAVTSAVMLSKDAKFQQWLFERGYLGEHAAGSTPEECSAEGICTYCGILSRSELKTNATARAKFNDLVLEFERRK